MQERPTKGFSTWVSKYFGRKIHIKDGTLKKNKRALRRIPGMKQWPRDPTKKTFSVLHAV